MVSARFALKLACPLAFRQHDSSELSKQLDGRAALVLSQRF
jgi:hypothetical protein